jgi:hypothetical protein
MKPYSEQSPQQLCQSLGGIMYIIWVIISTLFMLHFLITWNITSLIVSLLFDLKLLTSDLKIICGAK